MKSSKQRNRKRYTKDEQTKLIRWLQERSTSLVQKRLTWHDIENYSGFSKMRLSLDPEVMQAYHTAKAASRTGLAKRNAVPGNELQLRAQIAALQSEKIRFIEERNRWLLHWERWQYNAHRKGWDVTELEKPLQPARHRKFARGGTT